MLRKCMTFSIMLGLASLALLGAIVSPAQAHFPAAHRGGYGATFSYPFQPTYSYPFSVQLPPPVQFVQPPAVSYQAPAPAFNAAADPCGQASVGVSYLPGAQALLQTPGFYLAFQASGFASHVAYCNYLYRTHGHDGAQAFLNRRERVEARGSFVNVNFGRNAGAGRVVDHGGPVHRGHRR